MKFKLYHRITAALVFAVTLILYISSMQPVFAFWDPGEYTAVSNILGIPHPPGVPFNVLIGKVFSLIPLFGDLSMRIAFNSVLASAFAVLFVYLISVKVITYFKGNPSDNISALVIYFSSSVGAFALAFCGTFWFNAMETESESKAILFIALMLWLMLIWREKQNDADSGKYLLLCFFLTGLGVGAHLLVAQTILIIGLIFYLNRYKFSLVSAVSAAFITIISFLIVFQGVVIKFPKLIDSSPVIAVGLIVLLIAGIFYRKKLHPAFIKVLRFASLSIILVILGYSVYTTVLLRANVDNLPVNQNNPRNFQTLVSYLGREQYGEEPKTLPRRWSNQPQHRPTWENYTSDMDFLWRYQIRDMYLRYFAWQFIGREGYNQGDGVDAGKLFAIPFLLGLIGLYYVFKKDKKTALILLAAFLSFGVITALYQNQQNTQPRERDYFYVVSYMIYAIWIGLGVFSVTDTLRQKINSKHALIAVPVLMVVLFVIVPLNMLKDTYKYQNRSGNYLPYDYAYNLLQSLDKDAILVTNGDNDTFPLWCLQSVYGVRTDVRIINLSLANADWYNLQLKNERPYGALTVPFNYSDEQLKALQPAVWNENNPVILNVPPGAYPDTMSLKPDKLSFKVPPTINQRNGKQVITALQNSDLIVLDVIKANNWQRPFYFSTTVMDNYCVGLSDYLILEGMAQRLVPYKKTGTAENVRQDITEKCLMNEISEPQKNLNYGFLFRNTNNPAVFYEEVQERNINAYRTLFIMLVTSLSEDSLKFGKAGLVLKRMEEKIPPGKFKIDLRTKCYLSALYNKIGEYQKAVEYANESEKEILSLLSTGNINLGNQNELNMYLTDLYIIKGEHQKALGIINNLIAKYPNDPNLISRRNDILSRIVK